MDDAANEQLARLERRLAAIESQLGILPVADLIPPETQLPTISYAQVANPDPQPDDPIAHSIKPPPLPKSLFEKTVILQNLAEEAPAESPHPPVPRTRKALEETIGLRWTGWIGAVVLVIGGALGIQFAYANHWFAQVPPSLRLAFVFVAGVGLIGTGEVVFRRVNVISAASIFGAGVAMLFVGSYAGYQYYDLYSSSISMALMAASMLVGAAIAMRGNLVSIAMLSLIGAGLAPGLIGSPESPVVPFLFYLLMTQGIALFLATWGRGGKWWLLRGLSLS